MSTWGDAPPGAVVAAGVGGQSPRPLNAPPTLPLGIGIQPGPQSGVVLARRVIIFGPGGSGLFVYSPSPGHGNLIASIAAASGTDPYGNPYGKGFVVYATGPQAGIPAEIGMNGRAIGFGSGAASEARNAELTMTVANPNAANEQLNWSILGPVSTASSAGVFLQMLSDAANAPGIATAFAGYTDTGGTNHDVAAWGKAGFGGLIVNKIVGAHPGTSDTTLAAETWQPFSAIYGTHFTDGSPAARYRFEPIGPSGQVRLSGQVSVTAASVAGTTIATLPTGYRPAQTCTFLTTNNLSGAVVSVTAALGGTIQVLPAGNLNIVPAAANGNVVDLDGVTFPLD